MRRRFRQLLKRSRRPLFVGVALLGYLAAAFGIPLPARSVKDLSIPFPCQDRPCGCATAAECWQSCCCFSREEHLAWARAHHVEPPAGYADSGWNDRPERTGKSDCCQAKTSCCANDTPTKPSCCAAGTCDSSKQQQTADTAPIILQRWIVGSFFQTCRGLTISWVQAGAALPAPPNITALHQLPALGWMPQRETQAMQVAIPPPAPPPRTLAL